MALILRSDMAIFGASPDGITVDEIFEIKCPTKTKTVTDYTKNGVPKEKVFFSNADANGYEWKKQRRVDCG